jgi:hypothetical protein
VDVFVVVVEEGSRFVGGCCGDFERARAEFGFGVVHGCVGLALGGVVVVVLKVVGCVWNCFD